MNNESIIIFCMFCQCCCWTLYPERGRKPEPLAEALRTIVAEVCCWTLYPERGRKLRWTSRHSLLSIVRLLDSLPREGTETGGTCLVWLAGSYWLLDSLPREGTETVSCSFAISKCNIKLLDSLPREGTETLADE